MTARREGEKEIEELNAEIARLNDVIWNMPTTREIACTMGVGCDEAGVCYAEAHGEPDRCPRTAEARARREGERAGRETMREEAAKVAFDHATASRWAGAPLAVEASGQIADAIRALGSHPKSSAGSGEG